MIIVSRIKIHINWTLQLICMVRESFRTNFQHLNIRVPMASWLSVGENNLDIEIRISSAAKSNAHNFY